MGIIYSSQSFYPFSALSEKEKPTSPVIQRDRGGVFAG